MIKEQFLNCSFLFQNYCIKINMNAVLCIYNWHILGINNKMPWEVFPKLRQDPLVKKDLELFKHLTKDAIIVMGRKTWESLGSKPLPNRKMNIVITSNPKKMTQEQPLWKFKTPVNFLTKEEFEKYYMNQPNVWIIGGASLYEEYIPKCEQVYITNIHSEIIDTPDTSLTITSAEKIIQKLHESFCCFCKGGECHLDIWFKDYTL